MSVPFFSIRHVYIYIYIYIQNIYVCVCSGTCIYINITLVKKYFRGINCVLKLIS